MAGVKAERILKRLNKKSNRGFCGYPLVKIGFYGPDNKKATKIKLKASLSDDDPLKLISEWESKTDIRKSSEILEQIYNLVIEENIPTISMERKIMGCPHFRGEDYGIDQDCPFCPFWVGKTNQD